MQVPVTFTATAEIPDPIPGPQGDPGPQGPPGPVTRGLDLVRDFGADPTGAWPASDQIQAALAEAWANGSTNRFLHVPSGKYRLDKPLSVAFPYNMATSFGLFGYGAEFIADFSDPVPMLRIEALAVVRDMVLAGLTLRGGPASGESDGLQVVSAGGGKYLYNFVVRDMTVEGVNNDGFCWLGNVFECKVDSCYARDNGRNGMTLGAYAGGILSAFRVCGGAFSQNMQHGVESIDYNTFDLSFSDAYFRDNGKYGLLAKNGLREVRSCGFENNHKAAAAFDPALVQSGARINNMGTMSGCWGGSNQKQTHLVSGYLSNKLTMINCNTSWYGPAGGSQQMGNFTGEATGRVIAIGCGSNPVVASPLTLAVL